MTNLKLKITRRFEVKPIALFAILIPALALGGERPASAPPVDARLTGLEERLRTSEVRQDVTEQTVEALDSRVSALEGNPKGSAVKGRGSHPYCDCATSGDCICDEGEWNCQCPNCPKHKKTKEGRVRLLHWSASWCVPCKVVEPEIKSAGLWDKIEHYDWDSTKDRCTATLAGVDKIPALVLEIDGKVVDRHIGSDGLVAKAKEWLKSDPDKKPVQRISSHDDGDGTDDQIRQHLVDSHGYAWSQVSGMNRSELKAAHDRGHGGPAVVSKNYPVRRTASPVRFSYDSPVMYRPRYYYNPPTFTQRFYGGSCSSGSCPSCR